VDKEVLEEQISHEEQKVLTVLMVHHDKSYKKVRF